MLDMKIPYQSIREEGTSKLISIQMLPYMMSAKDVDKGYYLIPDGSGGLMYFNSRTRVPAQYKWTAYGKSVLTIDQYDKLNLQTENVNDENVAENVSSMPVFGFNNGNSGIFEYAYSSDDEFSINVDTNGYGVDLYRIYGEFAFHHIYQVNGMSKVDASGNPIDVVYQRVDSSISPVDRGMKLVFLSGDNSDYNAMASVYKKNLQSTNMISRQNLNLKSYPMILDIFMGSEKIGITNQFVKVTSFMQALDMISHLKADGVNNLIVNLKGWNKNGYGTNPQNFSPDGALGGSIELKKLSDYCYKNDIKLNLYANITDISGAFSSMLDINYAVRNANLDTVTDYFKSNYTFNPNKSLGLFKSFLNDTKKYKTGNVIENIGSLIYSDYTKNSFAFKNDTVKTFSNILFISKKSGLFTATSGGNIYAFKNSDLLTGINDGGSISNLIDKEVPFIQMLLSGNNLYVSSPSNLDSDPVTQSLRSIEYGSYPYFELSYSDTSQLVYTSYNKLFSACFSNWEKAVVDKYKLYNGRLSLILNASMIDHRNIQNDIVRLMYSNGVAIYINYSNNNVVVNSINIAAKDFSVVK